MRPKGQKERDLKTTNVILISKSMSIEIYFFYPLYSPSLLTSMLGIFENRDAQDQQVMINEAYGDTT